MDIRRETQDPIMAPLLKNNVQRREKEADFDCSEGCGLAGKGSLAASQSERNESITKLSRAVGFCVVFMVVEVIGGLKAGSLAILTDAAHLLSDVASFAISLFAVWAAGWQATERQSFGFFRLEILGALVSIQLIWLITGIIIYEAVERSLYKQQEVDGRLMFIVATLGLVVNLIMMMLLGHDHGHGHGHGHSHGHSHDDEHGHSKWQENGHAHLDSHSHEHDHSQEHQHNHKGEQHTHDHRDHRHSLSDGNTGEHLDNHAHDHSDLQEHKHSHNDEEHHTHGHKEDRMRSNKKHNHGHGAEHHQESGKISHEASHVSSSPGHGSSVYSVSHSTSNDEVTSLLAEQGNQMKSDSQAHTVCIREKQNDDHDGYMLEITERTPGDHRNVNVQGAYLHVLGDLIQSIGVMIAGAIIWAFPNLKWVDLLCTFLFSLLVLVTTIKLLRDIIEVLMESTPRQIDAVKLQQGIKELPGVIAVHEFHMWAITLGKFSLACHVTIDPEVSEAEEVLQRVRRYCYDEFSITHMTIQVECCKQAISARLV